MTKLQKAVNDLEKKLEAYFTNKLPALPVSIKELIVEWLWVLVLVSLIWMGVSFLMMMGTMLGWGMVMPIGLIMGFGVVWLGGGVILAGMVAGIVLLWKALPLLKARKIKGWRFLFYALLISIGVDLVILNLLGMVINGGIGLYILFQIKEYYK